MTTKKYPSLNLRKSKDMQEQLNFLVEAFSLKDVEGAEPRIVRMALRSLRQRVMSLQEEFGTEFMEVFKFKSKQLGKKET